MNFNNTSLYLFLILGVVGCGQNNEDSHDSNRNITPEILEQHQREDDAKHANNDDGESSQNQTRKPLKDHDDVKLRDIRWHSVVMTGDDSIRAFDNARKKVATIFGTMGVANENIRHLSRKTNEQKNGVMATSAANFEKALREQNIGPDDGCSVFMTSHGTTRGFYIKGQPYLTPTQLDQMLEQHCGNQPTVVLVSACYSGVFAEPLMQRPNRIILTAARKDRTSFGCSSEAVYTYWDGCLIDALNSNSATWSSLSSTINACVQRKERTGNFKPSEPQTRLGANVANLRLFAR